MSDAGLDLSRKRLNVCLLSDHAEVVEEFGAPPPHGVPVRGVIESQGYVIACGRSAGYVLASGANWFSVGSAQQNHGSLSRGRSSMQPGSSSWSSR